MNLILCCYNRVGYEILNYTINNCKFSRIAVFTHDNGIDGRIIDKCKDNNIFCSTENINKVDLPFKPDIISSVYYRYIIKEHVIKACNGKIFNAHPSLLPKHRGCSSVPWAIIEGDQVTGITFHYIDKNIDTGRILLQISIQISKDETQESLYNKCMDKVRDIMDKVRDMWPAALSLVQNGFVGICQEGISSYHKRGVPYDGKIDPNWNEDKVCRFIRAMYFPPLPGPTLNGKVITSIKSFREEVLK